MMTVNFELTKSRTYPLTGGSCSVVNSSRATPSSRKLPLAQVRLLAEAFVEGAPNYDVAYYETLLRAAADEVLT